MDNWILGCLIWRCRRCPIWPAWPACVCACAFTCLCLCHIAVPISYISPLQCSQGTVFPIFCTSGFQTRKWDFPLQETLFARIYFPTLVSSKHVSQELSEVGVSLLQPIEQINCCAQCSQHSILCVVLVFFVQGACVCVCVQACMCAYSQHQGLFKSTITLCPMIIMMYHNPSYHLRITSAQPPAVVIVDLLNCQGVGLHDLAGLFQLWVSVPEPS